jgi:ATP-dependent DNA helicase DinG
LIRRLGAKRIFMSATLPDFGRQARWLGIDPDNGRCRFLSLPSPFPEENRLIYCHPVVHWDRNNLGPSYDSAARELARILDRHPTQRGLVHVSSYKQAEEIVARCNSPRLLTHFNSATRAEALQRVFATPGAVLVSPSSREGLDFYGERSEFQVVLKLPFASLGDQRVRRRLADDAGWYGLTTAQQLVQAAGRSVRSMSDKASTYILDGEWPRFVRRNARFIPSYFLKATREMPA